MELTKFWADNKKTIITTAVCAFVALLVIKFFDTIFFGALLIAIVVGIAVVWTHLSKKHGGAAGVWKWLVKESGLE